MAPTGAFFDVLDAPEEVWEAKDVVDVEDLVVAVDVELVLGNVV